LGAKQGGTTSPCALTPWTELSEKFSRGPLEERGIKRGVTNLLKDDCKKPSPVGRWEIEVGETRRGGKTAG